jgi:hypothetical protein
MKRIKSTLGIAAVVAVLLVAFAAPAIAEDFELSGGLDPGSTLILWNSDFGSDGTWDDGTWGGWGSDDGYNWFFLLEDYSGDTFVQE